MSTPRAAAADETDEIDEPDCEWTEEEITALFLTVAGALPHMSLLVSRAGVSVIDRRAFGAEKVMNWPKRYCIEHETKALTIWSIAKNRTDLKVAPYIKAMGWG